MVSNARLTTARRPRPLVIGASAVALLAGGAALLPTLAHLLPPSVTGEGDRLIEALGIRPGMTVADVGAGRGSMALYVAQALDGTGRVYATEIDRARLGVLRRRVRDERLANVTILEGSPDGANLPPGCCDAVYLRAVYHHVGDPARFASSLLDSLRPGGRLAVIDFEPGSFWHLRRRPAGAHASRAGHGVGVEQLVAEIRGAGFTYVRTIDRWAGRMYLVLFQAP